MKIGHGLNLVGDESHKLKVNTRVFVEASGLFYGFGILINTIESMLWTKSIYPANQPLGLQIDIRPSVMDSSFLYAVPSRANLDGMWLVLFFYISTKYVLIAAFEAAACRRF